MNTNANTAAARPAVPMKLIVGLFFTALGILLTADNLDLLDSDQYLAWWPVVLVAAGLAKLTDRGSRPLAILLLLIGASLLVYNLGLVAFTIFDLWPLLLIGAGVVMVTRAFWRPVPQAEEQRANTLNTSAFLATRRLTSASKNFGGGNVFAFMSNCQLDLTEADIAGAPAVINASAVWAGIEIIVPDHWEVIGEVTPFMGGFELQPGFSVDSKRQLIIRGFALMAGIEVKTRRTS